jgi:hypothetical protein
MLLTSFFFLFPVGNEYDHKKTEDLLDLSGAICGRCGNYGKRNPVQLSRVPAVSALRFSNRNRVHHCRVRALATEEMGCSPYYHHQLLEIGLDHFLCRLERLHAGRHRHLRRDYAACGVGVEEAEMK